MASNTRDLLLRLLGDSSNLKKALGDADGAVDKHGLNLKNLAGTIGSTYAAAKVIEFGKASVEAAAADEASQKTLAVALRNTAGATDAQIAAAEAWIEKTMFATGVTDDELRPALERLTRATGDVGQAQDLLGIAMDASAGTGKSLQAVTEALGKAADGNVGALGRLGIATKDAEGKTLSFDKIVKNLATTFSGQSAAAADTAAGRMAIMKARFGELQEQIGTALMPIMEQLVGALSGVAEWFGNLDESTQTWIVRIGLLGGGLVLTTRAVNGILGPLKSLGLIGKTASKAVDGITGSASKMSTTLSGAALPALVGVGAVLATWEGLGAVAADSLANVADAASDLSRVSDDELHAAFVRVIVATAGVARNTDTVAESIKKMVVANLEGSKRLLEYELATYGASKMTDLLAASIAEVIAEEKQAARTAAGLTTSTDEVTTSTDKARLAQNAYEWTLRRLNESYDHLGGATADQIEADRKHFEGLEKLNEAYDDVIGGTKGATVTLEELNERFQESLDLRRSLFDQARSQESGNRDFEQTLRDTAVDLIEYNEELRKLKPASYEAATATAEMRDEIAETALAFARQQGAADNTKASIDLQVQSLAGLRDTLAPGSPLRVALDEYIAMLLGIPKTVSTQLILTSGGTRSPSGTGGGSQPQSAIPGADPLNWQAIADALASKDTFAEGGTVPGPVGSPRLIIAHGGEEVIPIGGRGGVAVIVTVNGSVTSERDLVRTIADGIIDAQRRGEIPGNLIGA